MTLNKYRQESGMLEAGGCLFGYYRGGHIHVAYCTEPMDGDTRNKFRFDRRDLQHLKVGKNLHEKYLGTCTYLGDWHTHPQNIPTPSMLDFREWDKIVNVKSRWKTIAIIVGRHELWVGVGSQSNVIRKPLLLCH